MEKTSFPTYNMTAFKETNMGTVKYLFQSLYKNQPIIDGRKKPWWIAVIVFVLSIAILMIAPLTKGYQSSGSIVLNPTYENGITLALDTLSGSDDPKYADFQKLYFASNDNGEIELKYDDGKDYTASPVYEATNIDGDTLPSQTEAYTFKHQAGTTSSSDNGVDVADSESFVYFSLYTTRKDLNADAEDINKFLNDKLNNTSNTSGTAYHSFLLLGAKSYILQIYSNAPVDLAGIQAGTKAVPTANQMTGTYQGLAPLVSSNKGKFSLKFTSTESQSMTNRPSQSLWVSFFDYGYRPIRDSSTWILVGIMAGVGAGLILLGGLIIFLFTLGRRNLLHKDCNVWQALQISIMSNFTIALITMILYFVSQQFAITGGILLYIMRLSFIIMRTMGRFENREQESKPLYQARS